jgi:hypothetical protein
MPENTILQVLSGLRAVLGVLAPSDDISRLRIEQRTNIEIEIEIAWQAGGRFNMSLFEGEWSHSEIIRRLFDEMQDILADSPIARGEARPRCNGHSHPRRLISEDGELWWECPTEGARTPAFRQAFQLSDL